MRPASPTRRFRSFHVISVLLLVAAMTTSTRALAGGEPEELLAWLVGTWRSPGATPDSWMEESWSVSRDGVLLGTFRWHEDGRVKLYELMTIGFRNGSGELRLRHFSPELKPWEAESPLVLPVVRSSPEEMVFEDPTRDSPRRLVYRRLEDDQLLVRVEGIERGQSSRTDFPFVRASPLSGVYAEHRASSDPPVAALEDELRAAESAFAKTMADRDVEAFASFLSEEAVFFGRTPLRGKPAVLEAWSRYYQAEPPPFSWEPETVVVLGSGRLGLSTGPVYDPEGAPIGTFSSIWHREPSGEWKIVFDKGCQCR